MQCITTNVLFSEKYKYITFTNQIEYINISLRVLDAALTMPLVLQVENVQQSEVH